MARCTAKRPAAPLLPVRLPCDEAGRLCLLLARAHAHCSAVLLLHGKCSADRHSKPPCVDPLHPSLQQAAVRAAATSSAGLGVPGLFLLPDFVSPEEEVQLLFSVDAPERCGTAWVALSKRRVQHHGHDFDYEVLLCAGWVPPVAGAGACLQAVCICLACCGGAIVPVTTAWGPLPACVVQRPPKTGWQEGRRWPGWPSSVYLGAA